MKIKKISENIKIDRFYIREDPFTLYESNLRFYSDLEEECCSELEHYPFPVFNPPKVKEVKYC